MEAYVNIYLAIVQGLKTSLASIVESNVSVASNVENIMYDSNDEFSKLFSILQWNVNGLFCKLRDNEFLCFLYTFDFVYFVETFMETFQSNVFVDYCVFQTCLEVVYYRQGHCSGGIVCLIKNE